MEPRPIQRTLDTTIETRDENTNAPSGRRVLVPLVLVAALAVIMGLPALGGGFVGGDDHRLLLDHVLVNHPSFEHAVKLFTIWHRDLYQPLALLSFQAEFALAGALGLFDNGVAGGAWLFHLTNVLLHATNTVLVWFVVRSLHGQSIASAGTKAHDETNTAYGWDAAGSPLAVATVAAVLFAVHPLQTEVVAWTNGRMMLLSTLFALLCLLSFGRCVDRSSRGGGVTAVLFALLSAISKVRIGLPVLLAIVLFARRKKPNPRVVLIGSLCALVTGVFVIVNVLSTAEADLFSEAAEHLEGPRLVRVLLALACYARHLVWPVGLASYYPTPPIVHWSDPATWQALAVVFVCGVASLIACRHSFVTRLGLLWFAATIGATLPLIPARNILAADRYMYLPIIGLLWPLAALGFRAFSLLGRQRRAVVVTAGLAGVSASIAMCWHVASFYATPLAKTRRIAQLFPTTPRVWERLGWTYYGEGRYHDAAQCAQKELRHDNAAVRSGAYQLLGMAALKLGNADEALRLLQKAVETDPQSALAQYRRALAYDELGRYEEAARFYERAVEAAPLNNPTINRLAAVYRRLGRAADARHMYEKALANNPRYAVTAIMGLTELDIEKGTRDAYLAAKRRLQDLLEWMPENARALTNLGVVWQRLGRTTDAVEAYRAALDREPGNVSAALNLAELHATAGHVDRARPLFEQAVRSGLETIEQARVVHDFFVSNGAVKRTVALWTELSKRIPDARARALLGWSYALNGDYAQARAISVSLNEGIKPPPLATSTLAIVELATQHYTAAVAQTDALCRQGTKGADARRRMLGALERFDRVHPDVAWTFCLAARLLIAEGNRKGARLSVDFCKDRCADDDCREQVRRLGMAIADPAHPQPSR